ncbi:Pectinesterase [Macleaya cordata]|uniref:Pectinesterase n=1 Tax=Macleaya cordata TaxID=56857 RepID=A0A200PZQ0_MACCD|nr:Pectinesterase [Macleaya cordata]
MMDSIKSFKGYGKVDEVEERAFRQKTRRRMIIITVSVIVLVTVIIGAVVGTLVHKNNTESSKPSSRTTPAESIKAVCSVTEYPKSCFTSLSSMESSNKADPEELFILSLQATINELIKLSALPDKLISKVKGVNESVKAALLDCNTLFEEAIDELNSTISSMKVGPGENLLSTAKINDIKTWLSSAITDQETCLEGLIEMNSTLVDEVKTAMKNSTEFTSNSLAIVSKILTILDQFNIPIHRKLLGRVDSEFPDWVNPRDRRLLQETNPTPDLTVAKDGTGDFTTIQEAILAVKKKNESRVVIYVKEGKYTENVIIDKAYWNIYMYGDGKDKTIISGSLNNVDGTPTFSTATFAVTGRGFIAKGIRFENTAGPEKHQAVALRSGSDRSVFFQCTFDAFQDTLYSHSNRQFYRECDIIGTIDFIFGNAAVVYQNCNIQPRQPLSNQFNTITAQGKKDPNQNTGISIQKCFIRPFGTVTARTYLGRPWKDYSTTVIMQTEIDAVVEPVGWLPWVANTEPPSTIFYAEYLNTGPGSILDKRVKWAGYNPTISSDEAGKYTVDSLIQGKEWLQQTNVVFESSL